jgi:predicted ATP-dependent endonuclease of OLD family
VRVKSIGAENFRCLDRIEVNFDSITTFIGPNGAGKSSVLRALDWFFNGDKSVVLTDEDVFSGATDNRRITVWVEFDQLTTKDRDVLGEKYAPAGVDEVTIWRTWDAGKDKITGKARAYLPFEAVRSLDGAGHRKAAYAQAVGERIDLTFPTWTSDGASEDMMSQWERDNPDELEEARVSSTNLFGFAGQGKLSGLFDFVLITADMRASEESQDNKTSVIGRILEKAVDRSTADSELAALSEELTARHLEITGRRYQAQLEQLSTDLSKEVSNFATGRDIQIESIEAQFKPQVTRFSVRVDDHGTKTSVERQGHGFQRSLLVAALKLLAQRGSAQADQSVILLAIEEPELFQHPAQAKSFAAVLRNLAEDAKSGIQIAYATHSPYFVEPAYFDQVRRVERGVKASTTPQVVVHHASMDRVVSLLRGYVDEAGVRGRLDNSCLNELRDALFGNAVLLVEGTTDRAIFEGVANKTIPLSVNGVEIAVATSKQQLYLPEAILRQLGIPHFTLFDSDSGGGMRLQASGKTAIEAAALDTKNGQDNKDILRYLGLAEQEWPTGLLSKEVGVTKDTLETIISSNWSDFEVQRQALIAAGRGSAGKNAATYRLAAKAAASPPTEITDIIDAVRALVN